MENKGALTDQGIAVKNAGIVILNSYIPMLFERLGFTVEKKFVDTEAQYEAVKCLQYLAMGEAATPKDNLSLNKVMCGLSTETVVRFGKVTAEQETLMESLMAGVIRHWERIGNTTADGLRMQFFFRNGILAASDDQWQLAVDKANYDIILHQSPFTFSIIRFPWMDRPLHVKWPK